MSPLLIWVVQSASGKVLLWKQAQGRGERGAAGWIEALQPTRGFVEPRTVGLELDLPGFPVRRGGSVAVTLELTLKGSAAMRICCNRLIRTICTFQTFFFCSILCLCQKALLRQDEKFFFGGKKIETFCFLIYDKPISNNVRFCWFLKLLFLIAATPNSHCGLFHTWSSAASAVSVWCKYLS